MKIAYSADLEQRIKESIVYHRQNGTMSVEDIGAIEAMMEEIIRLRHKLAAIDIARISPKG